MDGGVQHDAPDRQVEPTEVFGVALVLQIVEDRHIRTREKMGAVKPGLNRTWTPAAQRERQAGLLPKDARGAVRGAHRLRGKVEIRLCGSQILSGFAVRENGVLVFLIDRGQCLQQAAQIDLRASYAARNQIKRVDAD